MTVNTQVTVPSVGDHYVRLHGVSAGVGSVTCASEISVIMSHCTGARIMVDGIMGFCGDLKTNRFRYGGLRYSIGDLR